MYKNAVFYFLALLVILVGGFWRSYFSQLGGEITLAQYFHGISMLLWVLLLITQAWLIRTNRRPIHRLSGRASFVLAPLVVGSGLFGYWKFYKYDWWRSFATWYMGFA